MTKRLLKLSGSGSSCNSSPFTPFHIATPNSASSPNLAKENESLREELRRAKMALQASEERRSEVEKENAGLTEVLSEALDLLEHRSAVHKAQVATLEHELKEKTEIEEANKRLLREKQQHLASFSVRLDCCWCCCCYYYCCYYCCWVLLFFVLLLPLWFFLLF
jgi:hypothetical protein